MNNNDKVARRYLKKVKKSLVCPRLLRKRSLDDLKDSLDVFLEDHPAASEAEIVEQFGTPEEFANAFLASLDESELKKQLKRSRYVWIVVVATCVIALIAVVVSLMIMIIDNKKHQVFYITETIGEDSVPIDYSTVSGVYFSE